MSTKLTISVFLLLVVGMLFAEAPHPVTGIFGPVFPQRQTKPVFVWQSASTGGEPTSFQVIVSINYDLSEPIINHFLFPPYTFYYGPDHPEALEYETTYHFQIIAINEHGETPLPAVRTFTTPIEPQLPLPVTLTHPADNSTNVSLTPTLRWQHNPSGDRPTHYAIYVSTDNFVTNLTYFRVEDFPATQHQINSLPSWGGLHENTLYYWAVSPVNEAGWTEIETVFTFTTIGNVSIDDNPVSPHLNQLSQNYPNPFNPDTIISFSLGSDSFVNIEVFNAKGQKVKTLLNENRVSGDHHVVWNGKDDNNHSISSGLYFFKMTTDGYSQTKKMILMK
jgi:hypothetical protein